MGTIVQGGNLTLIASVQKAAVFIAIAIGIYLMQWGKAFIMPVVLALLLTDVLMPAVDWLKRKRFPNALAVTVVTCASGAVVLGLILFLSQQVFSLASELPNHRENVIEKVRSLRPATEGPFARLMGVFQEVSREISQTDAQLKEQDSPTTEPVQVEVVGPTAETALVATTVFTPVFIVLGNAGVVFALMFFFMLEHDLVTHRMAWLMRRGKMGVSPQTIDEASRRVGRYLRMQLVVNICSGLMVAGVCWYFAVPSPALLGAVAGALRYIPYVGPLLGITLPTLLAVAALPGWQQPIFVLAALLVAELITNMVLEPLLYGSSTGVSSVGVVVVAFFWGWLWGAMGLLLAMPVTVWIVLVGRHIPGLRPLAVVLSSESAGLIEGAEARPMDKGDAPVTPKETGWAE